MTVEVALVISVVSVLGSILFGFATYKRNQKADTSNDAYSKARTDVLLENISTDVRDIKSEQRTFSNDIKSLSEKLIVVEQSVKSAHHRIDSIEDIKSKEI